MTNITTPSSRLLAAAILPMIAILLAGSPAIAGGVNRAWVSGHGTDAAGCGAPTVPCRSLQYVHDHILAPGGEIDILDPAGYGSIAISKAISIVNDGVGTAGVQQPGALEFAIFIQAGSTDAITLRGLTIDGLGVAEDGVHLVEAGKLTMVDCVIRHFVHDGVYLEQTSGQLDVEILGTLSADNTANGFDISPSGSGQVQGVIDHSNAIDSGQNGVVVWGKNTAPTDKVLMTIANSNLSDNGNAGLYVVGSTTVRNALAVARNDIADFNKYGYYVDTDGIGQFTRTEALTNSAEDLFIDPGGVANTLGDNAFFFIHGTLSSISPN